MDTTQGMIQNLSQKRDFGLAAGTHTQIIAKVNKPNAIIAERGINVCSSSYLFQNVIKVRGLRSQDAKSDAADNIGWAFPCPCLSFKAQIERRLL